MKGNDKVMSASTKGQMADRLKAHVNAGKSARPRDTEKPVYRAVQRVSTRSGTSLAFAEARYGDNYDYPWGDSELAVGTPSGPTTGHVAWDPDLSDGVDSGLCPVAFGAAPDGAGGTAMSWRVKDQTLTHTDNGSGIITMVELVAGVRSYAAVYWTSVVIVFGFASGPPEVRGPMTGPCVDERVGGNASEAVYSLAAPPNCISVTVAGSIQIQADPGVYLAVDDAYAQVFAY